MDFRKIVRGILLSLLAILIGFFLFWLIWLGTIYYVKSKKVNAASKIRLESLQIDQQTEDYGTSSCCKCRN